MHLDSLKPVILIPARYQSSRFPGKPLALIAGQPMILRVFENMEESGFDTFVVTDNDEIQSVVESVGGNVLRVDDDVPSGSERIALAYKRFFDNKYDLIVNVQGDEPLLKGRTIQRLIQTHSQKGFDLMTLVRKRIEDEEDFNNPNIVKVAFDPISSNCQYFSRSPIPYGAAFWFQHIGVYSYKVDALMDFLDLPKGSWEGFENLEQLRALENRLSCGGVETQEQLIGVDQLDDIKRVENYLNGQ